MMKKILHIVDSYSTNYFHEMFNAGMVVACSQDADQVIYHAARSSQGNVLSLMEVKGYEAIVSKIVLKHLPVIHKESAWGLLCRTFMSAFLNLRYLFIGGKTPIVFMHNDAFSIYWLNLFNFLLKRPVWIVCHGELELLIGSPRWYKPSFLYKQLFRLFFNKVRISRNIHFIVLGKSILDNLKVIVSSKNIERFVVIEHPYFFERTKSFKGAEPGKIALGTVGAMNEFKGYYRLLHLVELFDEFILDHKLSFTVIGRLENVTPIHQDLIQYSTNEHGLLPREKYASLIDGLDYVLFLYAPDSYRLIASGAIFDAISFGKPVIALKNDYFAAIFEQCGEFGYLCDSMDEMFHLIEGLLNEPDVIAYENFLLNMKNARCLFSPESIKIDLF